MDAIIANQDGRAPLLLTCEHATNFIPEHLQGLGLPESLVRDHVAWDIGALSVARLLSSLLDAPMIAAPASRLLIDPNRAVDAADLIPEESAGLAVSANHDLGPAERAARIAAYHVPYHAAIERLLGKRRDIASLVSIHSFTPCLFGADRPWHVGVLHEEDRRLADPLLDHLSTVQDLVVGRNQPYKPDQGVFYAMRRHAGARAVAMIEVRNDQLRDPAGQQRWAKILAKAIRAALCGLEGANVCREC